MPNILIQNKATNTSGTVDGTTSEIIAANEDRQYAEIRNDSGSVVYLALGDTAVEGSGIRLASQNNYGSTYKIDQNNLYVGEISAIGETSSGTVNVTIVEK